MVHYLTMLDVTLQIGIKIKQRHFILPLPLSLTLVVRLGPLEPWIAGQHLESDRLLVVFEFAQVLLLQLNVC